MSGPRVLPWGFLLLGNSSDLVEAIDGRSIAHPYHSGFGGKHVTADDLSGKTAWAVLRHSRVGDDGARPKRRAAMKALVANPSLLLFIEVIGLALGLAMVLSHNIWSGSILAIVVTLVGWLIMIRSAVLLGLSPEATMKLVDSLQYEKRFYIYMGATLVQGSYLTYAGFSA